MRAIKRILVTGGAGFLGSHLCMHLINDGHYVICVDDLCTGSIDNIKPLLENPYFEFIEHDIIQPLNSKIDKKIDQIYNLACPASPINYQKNPIKTLKASVVGVLNMLDFADETGARFLQASTSEVYGDPEVHPQSEDYWGNVNPIGVRSCYDEGKRAAETLIYDYKVEYNIDVKIVRIFNTYGPNMAINDGRVVSNFIVQALKNEDITVYGDGTQTRCFCYVDDMIDGIYRMMNSSNRLSGPVNLGNPEEYTIAEFAKIVIEKINSKSKIISMPLPEDDPLKRKPAIDLAKKELNWIPTTSLSDGLNKTIDYFSNVISEGSN